MTHVDIVCIHRAFSGLMSGVIMGANVRANGKVVLMIELFKKRSQSRFTSFIS